MPADQWFPQSALATDPVAAHAGVVPTAKGVKQIPAWRPPVGVGQEGEGDRWYSDPAGESQPGQSPAGLAALTAAPATFSSLQAAATQVERETGIPASVLLAIPVNESGNSWGPGSTPYGIKAGGGWTGQTTGPVPTWESVGGQRVDIRDNFRTYRTPLDAMRDFATFITGQPRYAGALQAFQRSGDPATLLYGLNRAGYATDPAWADKILNIMHRQSGGQSVTSPTFRGATGASQPSSTTLADSQSAATTPSRSSGAAPSQAVARPKHWFTYADGGEEVLKVINEDGGSTFRPTGRKTEHPDGTVTNPGSLPVGKPLPQEVTAAMPQWEKEAFYSPDVGQGQDEGIPPAEAGGWSYAPPATDSPTTDQPLPITPRDVVQSYQAAGAPVPTDVSQRAGQQFAEPAHQTPESLASSLPTTTPTAGEIAVSGGLTPADQITRLPEIAGDTARTVAGAAASTVAGAASAVSQAPVVGGLLGLTGEALAAEQRLTPGMVPKEGESLVGPGDAIQRQRQREADDPVRAMMEEALMDPANIVLGMAPAVLGGTRALAWEPRLREALFADTPEGVGRVVPGLTKLMSAEDYDATMLRYGPKPPTPEPPLDPLTGQFREVPPTPRPGPPAFPPDVTLTPENTPHPALPPASMDLPSGPPSPYALPGRAQGVPVVEDPRLRKGWRPSWGRGGKYTRPAGPEVVRQPGTTVPAVIPPPGEQGLAGQGRELAQSGAGSLARPEIPGQITPFRSIRKWNPVEGASRPGMSRWQEAATGEFREIPRVVVPDWDSIHIEASRDPVSKMVRAVYSRLPSPETREIHISPAVAAAHPEGARMIEEDLNASARLLAGRPKPGEQVAAMYPGGWTQDTVDKRGRGWFTDSLASLQTMDTQMHLRDLAIQHGLGFSTLQESSDGYRRSRMLTGNLGKSQAWMEEVAAPIFQHYRIAKGAEARMFEGYMRYYEAVQRTLTQDIVDRLPPNADELRKKLMEVMDNYIHTHSGFDVRDVLKAASEEYQRLQPQVIHAGRAVPLETGPVIGTDSNKAIESLATLLDEADARFGHKSLRPIPPANLGPGLQFGAAPASTRARFAAAHRALSDALVPSLRDAEAAGILRPGAVDAMLREHPVYTHIQTLGEHFNGWAKGEALPKMLPTSSYVGKEIPSGRLFDVSLDGLMARQASLIQAIDRQHIANALEDWRQSDPQGFGRLMRPLTPPEMLNYHRDRFTLRPGTQLVPRFDAGRLQMYEVPKGFGDALMGLNKEQTGWMMSGLARFTRSFVGGVTAYSPSFLVNNFLRHEAAAHHNLQAISGVNLSYLRALGIPTVPVPTENRLLLENMLSSFWDSLTSGEKGQSFVSLLQKGRMPTIEERAMMAASNPRRELRRLGGEMYVQGYAHSSNVARARDFESFLPKDETPLQKVGRAAVTIGQPWKLIRAASEVTEMSTRVNIFKAALKAGVSEREAAFMARSVTIDYQKGGSAMKAINALVPFVNSYVQAIGRPLEALDKDPVKFAVQHAYTTVLPWAISYSMNRSDQWSDMYDRVSRWEKQHYFVIPVGTYTLPNGQQNMLRINVRKDESAMLITNLMEYMADQMKHTSYAGQPLSQNQRDERNPYQMWLQEIRMMVPIPESPSESKSGWQGILTSAALDIPFVNIPVELTSNTDDFGQPIVPPAQQGLPPELQYGQTYHPASALIAEQLGTLSQGRWTPSPAGVSWFFNTLPMLQIAQGGGDAIVNALGIRPSAELPPQRPGAPPTTSFDELTNLQQQQAKEDSRPWWAKLLPAIIKSSGGAQSLAAKLEQAPPEVRIPIQQSNQAAGDYADWRMTAYYPQRQAVMDNPNLTGQQKRDQLSALSQKRGQAYDDAYNKYPQAVKNYHAREALLQQIPGIPVRLADVESAGDIDPSHHAEIAQAAAQYQMVSKTLSGQISPTEVQKRQSQLIQNYAAKWGVDPAVVTDAIKAQLNQLQMPIAGVPNASVEEWVNRYLNPANEIKYDELDKAGKPTGSTDPVLLRRSQAREIERIAQETGLSKDTVRQRISLRLSSPEEQTDEAASLNRAQDLAARVHDPTQFPAFIDPITHKPLARQDGTPSGPDDWQHWAEQIGAAESARRNPRAPLPESVQHLVAAQAEGKRYMLLHGLYGDAQSYLDYLRWYGYGKNLTDKEWGDYLNGVQQRYRDVPAADVPEATRRDKVIAEEKVTPTLYNRMITPAEWAQLPYDEQQRRVRLRGEAKQYAHQAVTKWQDALKVDEVTPGGDNSAALDDLLSPEP